MIKSTYMYRESVRPTPAAASRVLAGQDAGMIGLDDPTHLVAWAHTSRAGPQYSSVLHLQSLPWQCGAQRRRHSHGHSSAFGDGEHYQYHYALAEHALGTRMTSR